MTPKAESLGWGLVGIGRHAERYIAPAIRQSSTGQLVAVYSRDKSRAVQFAERHGNPSAYDNLEALLGDPRVQVVFICSPNSVHKEQVLAAAAAGKDILCEKPLANSAEECQAMIDACRRARVKLGVGFNLRHNPAHIQAKELYNGGAIGELLFAEVQYMHVTGGAYKSRSSAPWRMDPKIAGGGSFVGTGVHAVDLLHFILAREISHVFAFADTNWHISQRERIIQASLLVGGEKVASLSGGNLKFPMNDIVLYGEEATLRVSNSIGNQGGGRIELVSDKGVRATEVEPCDVYVREVDAFAECLRTGAEPNASGHDGLKVAQVTAAVYESLRTKGLVEIAAL